jgi:uncharacterized membrane protein YdfJ with MMPL/SSD domain
VVPLVLIATVILSFAAPGVSAQAFDHLFDFAVADPAFALWTFVFLAALGVDHSILLMTRVHEEIRRHGTRRGALIGLAATSGVITSADVVLAGTFAALGTLPLVLVTEIDFAVAFGVLLDTFAVRSLLVNALNLDLGRWMWWPSRPVPQARRPPRRTQGGGAGGRHLLTATHRGPARPTEPVQPVGPAGRGPLLHRHHDRPAHPAMELAVVGDVLHRCDSDLELCGGP